MTKICRSKEGSPAPGNPCFEYTVRDRETGEILAEGSAKQCAKQLGFNTPNGFAVNIKHYLYGDYANTGKYIVERREIRVYKPAKMQLCWSCQKATGLCSWSHNLTPVKGWDAEIVECGRTTPGYTYSISGCPEYVKDKEKKKHERKTNTKGQDS